MATDIATSHYDYECNFYKDSNLNEFNRHIGGSYNIHVARCKFNTRDINNGCGSTSLSVLFDIEDFIESLDSGELYAVLTTNPSAYVNKYADNITDSLCKVALTRKEVYEMGVDKCQLSGTLSYNFLPNTDYYVFFVPKTYEVGTAEVISEFSLTMGSSPSCRPVVLSKSTGVSEVLGEGIYEIGSIVKVSAIVEEGFMFSGWSGSYSSNNESLTFTMPNREVNLKASAIFIECDLQVFPVVDGEDKPSGLSSAVRFNIYINDRLIKSDVLSYLGYHPYGTKYRVTRSFLSEDYRSPNSTISGTLTADTQLGYDIYKLLPPEWLSVSPTKFSNKTTLKWDYPVVSSGLIPTGYVIQRSVSEDGKSWSSWAYVSDIEDYTTLSFKDSVVNKYAKYRIRTSAKLSKNNVIYYSTKWTECTPEFVERGASCFVFDEENLVPVTAYIHDDYGDPSSNPDKVHSLRVFNGTEWIHAGIGSVYAIITDNVLVAKGSCTATIEGKVLSVLGSFSATIKDDILIVK